MKWFVLIALGCLAINAFASPIVTKSDKKLLENQSELAAPETGRQADQGAQAPAPAPAQGGDDDDSDDDDDLDIDDDDDSDDDDYDDDDDDDDDDEEGVGGGGGGGGTKPQSDDDDDDDDDYLERFFDDILGDDDDEDDESPAAAAPQPVVQQVQPQAVAPEVVAEIQPSEQSLGEIQYDDEATGDETNVVATIDTTAEAEKEPAPQVVTQVIQPIQQPQVVVQPVQPAPAVQEEEDEGDAEDEDDDDDDDEDDDDDDDEDDVADDIADVIEARQSQPRALDAAQGRVPPMYITKYNRYVDNVLGKINKILRNGYDPVNVRLHTVKSNKKGDKKKTNKKKKSKQKNQKKPNKRQRSEVSRDDLGEADETTPISTESNVEATTYDAAVTEEQNNENVLGKNATKQDESRAKTPQKKQKNKNKNNAKQSKPRAKATLYGLASLKRKNDVQVNLMSTHNTIKSKFSIGPLTLKVEKEFGRGAKKEIRSATATTTEMMGRINLRINHGGGATLHSIRVMQPNLLRIDNPVDHDKTREFVWKRSSHIAQIVSQKLTKAARSLLRSTPKKPSKKKSEASGLFSVFG